MLRTWATNPPCPAPAHRFHGLSQRSPARLPGTLMSTLMGVQQLNEKTHRLTFQFRGHSLPRPGAASPPCLPLPNPPSLPPGSQEQIPASPWSPAGPPAQTCAVAPLCKVPEPLLTPHSWCAGLSPSQPPASPGHTHHSGPRALCDRVCTPPAVNTPGHTLEPRSPATLILAPQLHHYSLTHCRQA